MSVAAVAEPVVEGATVNHHAKLIFVLTQPEHVVVNLVSELEVHVQQLLLFVDLPVVMQHLSFTRDERCN